MSALNIGSLKRLVSYDAKKAFNSNKRVFAWFKAKEEYENTFTYYLFSKEFDFDTNFMLLKQKFYQIEGEFTFYTDNTKYEPLKTFKDRQIQQTFPL